MNTAENQKKWIKSPKGIAYRASEAFKESVRKHRRTRDRVHRNEVVQKVRKIKLDKGCSQCGYQGHHAALEFHHRNPETKKFRIADSRNYSWKMVLAEIQKCDVLCSNCHAVLEYNKRIVRELGIFP